MNLKKTLKKIKLHQQELSILFGILIIVVSGVLVINYVRNLQQETNNQEINLNSENETIHTVVKGETLWKISETYYKTGSDWKKIAEANNIESPSKIEIGDKLIIPAVEQEEPIVPATLETTPSVSSPTPQITDEAASTDSEILTDTYVVVKGDSLWKIALRAYGDGNKWIKIADVNNLKNPNLIHSGNIFTIPR